MLRKKYLKPTLISLSLFGITFFVCLIRQKSNEKIISENKLKTLPEFGAEEVLMKRAITDNQLRSGRFKYVVFFNTECEHCVSEINEIEKKIDSFKGSVFLFVSSEEEWKLKKFALRFNFKYFPFLLVRDAYHKMNNTFGVTGFPTIYIYNDKNRLIKRVVGEIKIQKLIQPEQ